MEAIGQQHKLAEFFHRLRTAPHRALLLDYDGTLAPFHVRPEQARPYAGVPELLDAIMATGRTRVVLVSGRWTKDLAPLLGLKRMPEIWGSHGWEQLKPDGEYEIAHMNQDALLCLLEADAWAEEIEALGGRCERKPGGLAIHWRGLPPERVADIHHRVFENWMQQELQGNLVWHDFDGGIELRAPGRDKGYVVDSLLSEMGRGTMAAYLGDDLTDENAFKAIQGRGIGILVRTQLRATAADFWLQPPEELLDFLHRWHETSGE